MPNCRPGYRPEGTRCVKKGLKLYRVWSGDENDRSEIARIGAPDLDNALAIAKKKFVKPSALKNVMEDGDDKMVVLQWFYPGKDEEDEGTSEYIQVEEDEFAKPEDFEFNTIFGSNDYYELSKPGGRVRKAPDPYPAIARLARRGRMQEAIDQSQISGPMRP
jgi:hypothetical protein